MRSLARVCGSLTLLGCLSIAGCIPTPPGGDPRAANTSVPDSFGGEDTSGDESSTDEVSSAEVDWHAFFSDPHLVDLIELAVVNNQELNITIQEMIVANSEVMARRGDIFPSLSAGVEAGLDRVGGNSSSGRSDEHLGLDADLQNYSIGLYASWEVDIWGRLRDSADAAMYRYLASAEGRNFMITRLTSEIANSYYELLALDRQLLILHDNIELQRSALEMMRLQQVAARVTMLAVTRFEAQLRRFESHVFEVEQQLTAVENHLNFLVGRFPQHIDRSTEDFLAITPPVVHTGVPTALLENRPDVREAELGLTASALDVSATRAAFYPTLRLDAGVGVGSFDITRLVTSPESIIYNIVGGITAPLLNRSGITADYWAANSRQMQAVLRYEQTILSAFVDVSTGIRMVRNLARSYELQREQVDRLEESVALSNLLFNAARAEYLEVLTTRRDYLEAQLELVETKRRQLSATVTLYQALGGGWRSSSAEADPEPMGAMP
jgi:NodT family efflux transporter outer membrane factor (OMF) lipoprotein